MPEYMINNAYSHTYQPNQSYDINLLGGWEYEKCKYAWIEYVNES